MKVGAEDIPNNGEVCTKKTFVLCVLISSLRCHYSRCHMLLLDWFTFHNFSSIASIWQCSHKRCMVIKLINLSVHTQIIGNENNTARYVSMSSESWFLLSALMSRLMIFELPTIAHWEDWTSTFMGSFILFLLQIMLDLNLNNLHQFFTTDVTSLINLFYCSEYDMSK